MTSDPFVTEEIAAGAVETRLFHPAFRGPEADASRRRQAGRGRRLTRGPLSRGAIRPARAFGAGSRPGDCPGPDRRRGPGADGDSVQSPRVAAAGGGGAGLARRSGRTRGPGDGPGAAGPPRRGLDGRECPAGEGTRPRARPRSGDGRGLAPATARRSRSTSAAASSPSTPGWRGITSRWPSSSPEATTGARPAETGVRPSTPAAPSSALIRPISRPAACSSSARQRPATCPWPAPNSGSISASTHPMPCPYADGSTGTPIDRLPNGDGVARRSPGVEFDPRRRIARGSALVATPRHATIDGHAIRHRVPITESPRPWPSPGSD